MKAIVTKYHGPTDFKGSRISAYDSDGNRVTISYDHGSRNPHQDAAIALVRKMGWQPATPPSGWLEAITSCGIDGAVLGNPSAVE